MSASTHAVSPMSGTRESYGGVLQAFHWTIVVLVAIQYLTKAILPYFLEKPGMRVANAWHLGVGSTILVLMVLRLVWRLTHTVPPAPHDLPPALRVLSRATHWAFYALLVLLPIGGWVAVNGFGGQVKLAGLISLPALIGKDEATGAAVGDVHATLAWVLLALIVLHAAGAIYHGVLKRDGVVGRMLPRGA